MPTPIDLCGLPVWERAATVTDRARELCPGEVFEFTMELDPRALIAALEQQRPGELRFASRRTSESQWLVTIVRLEGDAAGSSFTAALTRSPSFASLDGDLRAVLAESMTEHTARKSTVVCAENTACTALGVLLEGTLGVFAGLGNRERLLFQLFPLDVFGAAEFFDRGLSLGRTAVVSKFARYATIPFDVVDEVGRRDPALLAALGAWCAQRLRVLSSALAAQVSKPILVRVAAALLPYAPPARGLETALPPLPTMTQSQIAAAAGTVKEVAARAIAELERLGAVRRERGHVRYLDRSKLLETIET